MAGEIHVYFHNASGNSSSGLENVQTKSQKNEIKKATSTQEANNQEDTDNSLIKGLIIDSAKKIALNGISHMGDLTGNYLAQRNVESIINFAGTAIQLMNWPVGTIATAVNLVTTAINDGVEKQLQNAQIELLRQRSGDAVNDERGTKE